MQHKNIFKKLNYRASLWMMSLVAAILVIAGCRKSFDQPPYSGTDPDIPTNATIASVKKAFDNAANPSYTFTDSLVFSAIVISSDSAGNVFKTLYVEDSTGGMNIQVDASNLYSNYPKGMRVFIKMVGLSMNLYGGSYEIGQGFSAGKLSRIPSAIMSKYIIPGSTGHVVAPVVFDKISDITSAYQSMLIQINNVQFADTTAFYADSTKATGYISNNVTTCSGESAVVYTSSYASFAGKKVAKGKGAITAIYVPYNTTKELILNDLNGTASMTDTRCGGGSTGQVSNIVGLRSAYAGKDVAFTNGSFTGVVVSSPTNESSGNVRVVQEDNAAGILVYAPGNTTYNLGDKVTVNLAGSTLTNYNGELELKSAAITVTAPGGSVTPLTTTLANVIKGGSAWSTRLVTIPNLTVSTSSTTSTTGVNYQLSDGTNSILSFVRNTASITLNPGTATVTGYVTIFKSATATDTTLQLTIRNANDVVYGAVTPPSGDAITLTSSPLTYDLNGIASGLPAGFYVRTGMSATDSGTLGTFNTTAASWGTTSFGFNNYASATGLTSTTLVADQAASTNRAIGVRQTASAEAGTGFVLKLANTTGKSNLGLNFDLQSLDGAAARSVAWTISYAIGEKQNTFTAIDASKITGTMTTGGSLFSSNNITVDLSALNNTSSPIYIRVSSLASTGSGSRPVTAIDNVKFTWK